MADEGDLANDIVEIELSRALDRMRQSTSLVKGAEKAPKDCLECGDIIPDARRKLGFKLCVSCASEGERKKQMYAS
jgi:RNA polymerase-binding transcription factor DksA